jgi:serine protease Do
LLRLILLVIVFSGLQCGLRAAGSPGIPAGGPDVQSRSHTYLGVAVAAVDQERAAQLKLNQGEGVWITWVEQDSPAAHAGLKWNDVLLKYNDEPIGDTELLGRLVRVSPPGQKVRLTVLRDGKILNLTATLQARKHPPSLPPETMIPFDFSVPRFFMPDMPAPALRWRSSVLGVEYEVIESQLAGYFGVKQGLLIRFVLPGSPAQRAGMQAGDVIVGLANKSVANARDVTLGLRAEQTSAKPVPVQVVRNHKKQVIHVSLGDMGSIVPESRHEEPTQP